MANKYVKGRLLGEGTWGVVYEGTSKVDNSLVAIKRIRPMVGKEKGIYGVNFSALREIKYLKEIKHEYIIQLLDVYMSDGALHLVFEYCVSDLEHVGTQIITYDQFTIRRLQVIKNKDIFFSPGDIKSYMHMLMSALEHCHRYFILHRDLKPVWCYYLHVPNLLSSIGQYFNIIFRKH